MEDLLPRRQTLVLPEHLNDFKHEIHCQYGEIEAIGEDGQWRVVTWVEGLDPHQPRREPWFFPHDEEEMKS